VLTLSNPDVAVDVICAAVKGIREGQGTNGYDPDRKEASADPGKTAGVQFRSTA
jgi:hypothetical protein